MGSHIDINCPPRKMCCDRGPVINCAGERTAIDDLPDECIQEIFMRLAGRERSISACVFKRWLMLLASIRYSNLRNSNLLLDIMDTDSESESINEDLDMTCVGILIRNVERTKASDVRLASIAVSTSSRGGLDKLSIRRTNDVPDIGLSAIARCCPSLRHLSLWNVASFGDQGLVEIAKECRLLEKLDLCHCPSPSNTCVGEIAKNSNVSQITIQSCANIGDESLHAIAKFCPNLQSIAIKACPLVSDNGITSVISECPLLTTVKLQALNITDFSLSILGNYGKAITNLFLSRLQNVTAEGFWVMGNAPGLRNVSSLNISFCKITDLSLQEIVKGCPELMYLTLRECCFASDNTFATFAKLPSSSDTSEVNQYRKVTEVGIFYAIFPSNSKLKSLAIVKCKGVKDIVTRFTLLHPCASLRSLSIRSCHGFGTTILCKIGRLCPKLRRLDLSGLNHITTNKLSELLLSCTRGELTKVDLSHCSSLTDEAVIALVADLQHPLDVINLNGCPLITDASLACIGRHCPLLKEPDVSKCSITDDGVSALTVRELRCLKVLSFSGCLISDMSSPIIERIGARLKQLNIRDCPSITSSTVESLTQKLRGCKIIS